MKPFPAALLIVTALAPIAARAQLSPEAEVEAALQHYADLLRAMDDHGIAQSFTSDGEVVNPGQEPVRGPEAIEKGSATPPQPGRFAGCLRQERRPR